MYKPPTSPLTYDQQTEVVRKYRAQLHDLWTTKHPTIDDILKLIIAMETEAGGGRILSFEDHFSNAQDCRDKDNLWPEQYTWIHVYYVTGGSEGYWLHVDVEYLSQVWPSKIVEDKSENQPPPACEEIRTVKMLILGKSLSNWRHEEMIRGVGRIAMLLGA